MKRMIVGLLSVCLLGSLTVLAEEKATAEKTVKKEAAPLVDITATGTLAKHAMGFIVTEADGSVVKVMAQKAAKEGEAAVVDNEKIEKDEAHGRLGILRIFKKLSKFRSVFFI